MEKYKHDWEGKCRLGSCPCQGPRKMLEVAWFSQSRSLLTPLPRARPCPPAHPCPYPPANTVWVWDSERGLGWLCTGEMAVTETWLPPIKFYLPEPPAHVLLLAPDPDLRHALINSCPGFWSCLSFRCLISSAFPSNPASALRHNNHLIIQCAQGTPLLQSFPWLPITYRIKSKSWWFLRSWLCF